MNATVKKQIKDLKAENRNLKKVVRVHVKYSKLMEKKVLRMEAWRDKWAAVLRWQGFGKRMMADLDKAIGKQVE